MYSDYEPFSEAERQKVVSDMQRIYGEFLAKVARNRKMDKAAVDRVGRGRVWSGRAALRLKLVDAMGGLGAAVDEARKLARIPAGERFGIRVYPQKKSFFEMIFELAGARARSPLDVRERLQAYQNYFPALALPFALRCF
jgi:protease-4